MLILRFISLGTAEIVYILVFFQRTIVSQLLNIHTYLIPSTMFMPTGTWTVVKRRLPGRKIRRRPSSRLPARYPRHRFRRPWLPLPRSTRRRRTIR